MLFPVRETQIKLSWDTPTSLLECLTKILVISSADKDAEQLKLVGGTTKWPSHFGK